MTSLDNFETFTQKRNMEGERKKKLHKLSYIFKGKNDIFLMYFVRSWAQFFSTPVTMTWSMLKVKKCAQIIAELANFLDVYSLKGLNSSSFVTLGCIDYHFFHNPIEKTMGSNHTCSMLEAWNSEYIWP